MRIAILMTTLCSLTFNAYGFYEDPKAMFPTSKNFTNHTTVTMEAVDNVQEACEKGSHKRGLGGFNYAVEACSFWTKSTCHVITAKMVNLQILGHEMRHCLQGPFH